MMMMIVYRWYSDSSVLLFARGRRLFETRRLIEVFAVYRSRHTQACRA